MGSLFHLYKSFASYNILPPENIYNVSYPYGGETSRNLIPYITFPLPDITNGYNSLLDLSTQHITTFGLPVKESINTYVH
jgi:hypothetical protein